MNTLSRRKFLTTTSQACLGCCALMVTSELGALNHFIIEGEILDPLTLNYCGYTCPEGCEFKKASIENDPELKKEAFDAWGIQERYGIEFEADEVFCFGCKNTGKPDGVVTSNCTVRTCVMEKNLECCIECEELTSCDKDLWKRFPKFKEKVEQMQVKYQQAKK